MRDADHGFRRPANRVAVRPSAAAMDLVVVFVASVCWLTTCRSEESASAFPAIIAIPPVRPRKDSRRATHLNCDLRPDLHDPVSRKLKVAARVIGILGKEHEQLVLPMRHTGTSGRTHGSAGQEKCRGHDVEA
jgi:hypothetical protein